MSAENQDADHTRRNFWAFVWHATWLSTTSTFTEINTVLPSLILKAGGKEIHVGALTAIMVGIPLLTQFWFAAFLGHKKKKPYLLLGIYLRVLALGGAAWTLIRFEATAAGMVILLVYVWMLVFSTSGSFAGISYTDILGKSIQGADRRRFFGVKQFLSSWGLLASALVARQILKNLPYPRNYTLLLGAASATLLVASLGFLAIRERPTRTEKRRPSIRELLRLIPHSLRTSPNLRLFILISNLIGLVGSLGPFYVVLARNRHELTADMVGGFLLGQIAAMIVGSLIWSRLLNRTRFKKLLQLAMPLAATIPLFALFAANFLPPWSFVGVFVLSGLASSGMYMGIEGAFLEITTESDRVLFSGIRGTFNIVVALFPLVVGAAVASIGYTPIFVLSSAGAFVAAHLVGKLSCPADNSAPRERPA